MRRLGPLLAVIAAAVVLAWLGAREGPPLPTGSPRSPAPDGARGLFLWLESIGRRPQRLESLAAVGPLAPRVVLVLAPVVPLDAADRQALDAVPAAGGTLILAGNPQAYAGYLEGLGITATTGALVREARTPEGNLTVRVDARERLRGTGAVPLLVAPDGGAVAVRRPYLAGQVVVSAGVRPFTNDGLRDEGGARWAFRLLDGAAPPGAVAAFDETHYRELSPQGEPVAAFDALLRDTAPGRAVVYAALLTFGFLLLGGRRLGPPLVPAGATGPGRTMLEHVQALAGLYRRAGQLPALRRHFALRAGRALAAGRLTAAQRAGVEAAVARIESAPNERALVEAVKRAEAVLDPLPVP